MAGRFVFVVGPSGAGKDTLIAGAKAQLAGNDRFIFPHRLITRDALPEAEEHGTITRDEFDAILRENRYALAWEAHGLGYVIPQSVADSVAKGHIAVCNTSRKRIAEAVSRYPGTHVICVGADIDVRAQRLAGRGRESLEEIKHRLARDVPEFGAEIPVTNIDNSGTVEKGIAAFVAALLALSESATDKREHA